MRRFWFIALTFLATSPCPVAESQQHSSPEAKKEQPRPVKDRRNNTRTFSGKCEGAFMYGASETQTFYLGTDPKRYRLSLWLYQVGTIEPFSNVGGGKHSGAFIVLDGTLQTLEVPYAPVSVDVEAKQIDVKFPAPPVAAPQLAVCFESLP
jgi:hypothetical protein